ncbi:hypothetical protein JCM18918_2113 [Cutibacterium acnes JCM 18918]|nr:hypothetical protein JCM18918_2113 [Cutibacterium acnes JCM 18918]
MCDLHGTTFSIECQGGTTESAPRPGYPCQSLINYVLIKAVAILHTTQGRAMRSGN